MATPEEKAAAKAAKDAEKAVAKASATSASVYTQNGGHVRTYTLEDHGEGFHDLAKEMAAQHPGSRIDVR